MINFTIGPVMSYDEELRIAGCQTPYFRTKEFSQIMIENEKILLDLLNAPNRCRCAFLTTSGTGAMEASVMGLLSEKDYVAVVNGGTFGQRFVNLCKLHHIPYTELKCEFGEPLKEEQLKRIGDGKVTAFIVNMDETSSGILYDMKLISKYCKENDTFLIVDAISSFLADEFDMNQLGADAVIIASQKALALQPGLSVVIMNERALERVNTRKEISLYLSLKEALANIDRGQTPYTPAVSILIQMNSRLKRIQNSGGNISEIEIINKRADYFRKKIVKYPFDFVISDCRNMSNAVTALKSINKKAPEIFDILKNRYNIWICPNGGVYKDEVFRVGNIGNLKKENYDYLFEALDEMMKQNEL